MNDTTDALDAINEILRDLLDERGSPILASDVDRWADELPKRLTAAGWVVVKADGLQHGDELVRLGTTWSSLTGDPPPPPTYVLRRPVPENGASDE